MAIRSATLMDLGRLVAMSERFLAATPYGEWFPPVEGGIEYFARELVERHLVFVAERQGTVVGMIAGFIVDAHPLTGRKQVDEVVWWVDPEARDVRAGAALLVALKLAATKCGASVLKLSAPAGSNAARFLTAHDYVPVETSFYRLL